MSSTALAVPRSDSLTVIRSLPGIRNRDGSFAIADLASLLATFQSSTGQFQKAEHVVRPAKKFERLWSKALAARSESAWHLFPEEVFEQAADQKLSLDGTDANFLCHVALDSDTPTPAALAAIRLMGILAEEGYLDLDSILPKLQDILSHEDPQRRHQAVKAIWQAKAREAVPHLHRRLNREKSEAVREVMRRAIAVLER